MLKLIDSHCHLDQLTDIVGALERAAQAGVEAVVCVGTNYASDISNLDLIREQQNPKLYLALGIHPTEIETEKIEAALKFINENVKAAVAIGEIGLDFWQKGIKKDPAKKLEQEEVFKKQLALAKEFDLPVSIHSRGSWQRCLELTQESKVKKAVFHWYSGPVDILQEIINAGFFVSATPALMYSPQHQEAMQSAPAEKILLETDSPVFFGERETGFQAEPKDVFKTLKLLSALKGILEEELAQITTQNAKELFGIN
ncbi:MAG: TatD family hydrolase [Candidatus Omnitrophota bacterium]|nr:TatD family hydrolase [Candidatus Omnitrophota bacterium]